ncbi:hypothetical protein A8F95_05850 [Bacillus wudalianchiensis]|uniref:SLH domain-containing protein n=2 Tax=Pseudobacillus wudalianchiensis TaxID=1743143 RepID=A0A1B9AYN2_9BACI|nr:hypothetical protein A8F95_05850 [Bacillus wudalianchiensis]
MATMALCSMIILVTTSTAQASGFSDVPATYWAYDDIQFLSSYEVINGYEDGKFRPGNIITRKDAAVMMTRALELTEPPAESELTFTDVKPSSPGYNQILIAMTNDWFTLRNGAFEPDQPLTRDEMAKALAMAFSYEGKETSEFTDVPKDDPYYPFIDAIAHYKVTTGYKDNTFRPAELVTRAQFSAFLSRVFQQPASYEVRNAGEVVANVPSFGAALSIAADYPQSTIHPASTKYREFPDKIATKDQTGLKSGVLIYNGVNEKNTFTKEFFDKYTSYQTPDGQTKDFFNTFIILGLRYDGGWLSENADNHANYSDWRAYINRTFAENGALQQLNASAKSQNKKADVYVAIPYPKRGEPILKLNDEEVESNLESRTDMVNWYISEVQKEWDNHELDNLNFKGYYWLNETVRVHEDELLLSAVSERIHADNQFFIYAPHATSTNFRKWRSYGFDAAFLQPNAFRENVANKEERLHRAFLYAQMYGTGITIEINSYSTSQAEAGVEAFNLYMDFAKRYGLDEKGMTFYQGVNMVARMATYDHPIFRQWYRQLTETFFSHPKSETN